MDTRHAMLKAQRRDRYGEPENRCIHCRETKGKRTDPTGIGRSLGADQQAVSKWETGDGLPDITILPALAENLGVTVDELLAGERRPKTPGIGEQTRKYLEDRAHRRQVVGLLAVAVIGVCGGLLRTSEWLYWVMLIVSIAGYIGVHVYFPGKEPLRRRVLFGALWGAGMKGLPFVALYTSWMRGQIADGSTPKAVIKDLVIDWYE